MVEPADPEQITLVVDAHEPPSNRIMPVATEYVL
jgi:hypothetical protein